MEAADASPASPVRSKGTKEAFMVQFKGFPLGLHQRTQWSLIVHSETSIVGIPHCMRGSVGFSCIIRIYIIDGNNASVFHLFDDAH